MSKISTVVKTSDSYLNLRMFCFSVTVSAKESDNSVHAAIQSLVRHLLQQKMKKKRVTAKGGRFTKNEEEMEEKNYVTISPLEITEKKEFIPLIVTKVPEVIKFTTFNKL